MSKVYKLFDDSIGDSKDYKFYVESFSFQYKNDHFEKIEPEEQYPPKYRYWAVFKDGSFFTASKKDGKILLSKVRMSTNSFNAMMNSGQLADCYETDMKDEFTQKIYTFKDLPEKKKYIIEREKNIYENVTEKQISEIMDDIKITFRDQKEKGASNHKSKRVYIGYRELEKYNITTEQGFLDYLNHAKSPLTHEVTHIFQNLFNVFPDIKYTKENENGEKEIDYEKYVNDDGEKQARIEQIIELLKWGFVKDEIVEMLYSRKHGDKDLWRDLIDGAIKAYKHASSNLPGDDYDIEFAKDINHSKGRQLAEWRNKKNRGNNYEQDYISSGTISNDMFPR